MKTKKSTNLPLDTFQTPSNIRLQDVFSFTDLNIYDKMAIQCNSLVMTPAMLTFAPKTDCFSFHLQEGIWSMESFKWNFKSMPLPSLKNTHGFLLHPCSCRSNEQLHVGRVFHSNWHNFPLTHGSKNSMWVPSFIHALINWSLQAF